jgi:hypothetical protein
MNQLLTGILMWMGIKMVPMEDSYIALVSGKATADLVYKYMKPNQVQPFIELHQKVKTFVAQEQEETGTLSPEMLFALAQVIVDNPRRLHVALTQIDNLIENLEKNILRKRGENVVRRIS